MCITFEDYFSGCIIKTEQHVTMKKLKYAIGEILMGVGVFFVGIILLLIFVFSLIPIRPMKPRRKCQKCGLHRKKMTKHHIFPRCFFRGAGEIVTLCRDCHDKIEIIYMREERKMSHGCTERYQLSRATYQQLTRNFLKK